MSRRIRSILLICNSYDSLFEGGERFDLVVTMYYVGEISVFDFSEKAKGYDPDMPIVLLSSFSREVYRKIEAFGRSSIDYVFCWNNSTDLIIAIIIRGRESVVPKEDVVLQAGDKLVIGAEPIPGEDPVEIRELEIGEHHKWNGFEIRELDISRQSYIVMVKRGGEILAPSGSLIIRAGDNVYMYTKKHRELA